MTSSSSIKGKNDPYIYISFPNNIIAGINFLAEGSLSDANFETGALLGLTLRKARADNFPLYRSLNFSRDRSLHDVSIYMHAV